MSVSLYSIILGFGSIALIVLGILLFLSRFVQSINLPRWVIRHGILIGFLAATAAAISSLIYSQVIGYPPCLLCWYARIFLFSQVVIYLTALISGDKEVFLYTTALSAVGIVISAYHYIFVEMIGIGAGICSADAVSCEVRYVFELGFITIPFMALAVFIFLAGLGYALLAHRRIGE